MPFYPPVTQSTQRNVSSHESSVVCYFYCDTYLTDTVSRLHVTVLLIMFTERSLQSAECSMLISKSVVPN